VNHDHRTPWDLIKQQLESELSTESYENWIARTRFGAIDGKTMVVVAPDEPTVSWLNEEFSLRIQAQARALRLGIEQVVFEAEPDRRIQNGGASRNVINGDAPGAEGTDSPVLLNPRFTFDSFVVGACNQFAHAAAQAVAMNPSRQYNPLYIYGGVGMGKTHLMHAIGRALVARGRMRIIYTTSERFTNEVVSGIKHGKMPQLREKFRSADVLLIDDIQSLGSKDRTQEEFFHTFNDLHESMKQIVISSDCPPKEIPGLVERLRSRFEWGLMADIQPPDLETKMAILQKKAELDSIDLPNEVCAFVANQTKSNVRELEGALLKLSAFSELTKTPITIQMAKNVLRHLFDRQEKRITIETIQKSVADKFGVRAAQLKEKSNRKDIVMPRQVAMFLCKELTQASLPEIGRAFGGKHHTTVIHSVNKIQNDRQNDPELNKLINTLLDALQ
jgi:chromosomal replication initiator protein